MTEWSDFKAVLALSRAGTMSGAAKLLGVDHTTIGRRLSALEDALGEKLFKRTPRKMVPTEAGRDAISAAATMEEAAASLERRLKGRREDVGGTVRVTTSTGFVGVVAGALPELCRRHPDLRVELVTSNAALDLTQGEADVAIRLTATPQQGLIEKRLVDIEWGIYASQSYLDLNPIAEAGGLDGHSLLGFDRNLAGTPGAVWAEEHAGHAEIVMRGNSLDSVRAGAKAGLGLAGLPRFYAKAGGLVVARPDTIGAWPCKIVFHADLKNTPRIRTVVDFLTEYIRSRRDDFSMQLPGSSPPT